MKPSEARQRHCLSGAIEWQHVRRVTTSHVGGLIGCGEIMKATLWANQSWGNMALWVWRPEAKRQGGLCHAS